MFRLGRTFEAIVFDWEGTAVRDRRAPADAVRRRVEDLCARGVDVAVVSGTNLGIVDGQLKARPAGPGRLWMALNRGSELYAVEAAGPHLVSRRRATPGEEAALDRAATLVVERLAAKGLTASLVSSRLNRRKIDLIPEREWADPPKAHIDELLDAVTARLSEVGLADLTAVVAMAEAAGKESGLADPKVTSDVKHVEIGLTDKSDSMRALLGAFSAVGVGPGLVLIAGDEFGGHGGVPGTDSFLLVPGAARATAVSVGVEPTGVPDGVRRLGGGPRTFAALLEEQLRRRADRRVPAIDEDPAWVLEFDATTPREARKVETLLCLGDGTICLRGSREEVARHEAPLVLASGVYAGVGPGEHLQDGPWPLSLEVDAPHEQERRVLDLRTGVLLREAESIRTLRFVAADRGGVVALRAEGPPDRLARGPVVRQVTERPMTSGRRDGTTWARTSGEHGGVCVVASETVTGGGRGAGGARRRGVERFAAYAIDPRRPPAISAATFLHDSVRNLGFDRLLAEHRATWQRRWAEVSVGIPDDPQAQQAVRFALFHLWGAVVSQGEAAVGARGLSGTGYAGHVFWDTDVFVLPAVAAMSPPAARAMLEYRIRRLPRARSLAAMRGLAGARFPWESAADGDDVTPQAGRLAGAWVPILTGHLEEHIVADVAWAADDYAQWTGDGAFLDGRSPAGRPLVTEGARYWASRAAWDRGTAHIRRVIGPDEYHEDVDDNVYTNVMARWNLRRAAALEGPSEESATWLRLADALVDGYDAQTGRHEQFAGFDDLQPLLVSQIGTPPLAADLLLGTRGVHRSQIIKQPDVLMAHHVVPDEMTAGSLGPDLDFYLPRLAHGSSLSPAIVASLLARAGRPDEALALLDIALRIDLDDLNRVTGSGLHLATMGGVWQALLRGFAGARVRDGVLSLDPVLPERWRSLELRFRCLHRRVALHIEPEAVHVSVSGKLRLTTALSPATAVARAARLLRTDNGWVVHS